MGQLAKKTHFHGVALLYWMSDVVLRQRSPSGHVSEDSSVLTHV